MFLLKQLINGVGLDNETAKSMINARITQVIAPSRGENETPFLGVLSHTIRSILYPTISYENIPNLLDLLEQVDLIRQSSVRQAADALKRDEREKDATVKLTDAERKKLKKISQQSTADCLRDAMRTVALHFCWLHIDWIWRSSGFTFLPKYMQMYFPMHFNSEQPSTILPLFMSNLSNTELEETRIMGKKCRKFILDANAWEENRENEWQNKKLPKDMIKADVDGFSYTQDFREAFQLYLDEVTLSDFTEKYLKEIEKSVSVLSQIFEVP